MAVSPLLSSLNPKLLSPLYSCCPSGAGVSHSAHGSEHNGPPDVPRRVETFVCAAARWGTSRSDHDTSRSCKHRVMSHFFLLNGFELEILEGIGDFISLYILCNILCSYNLFALVHRTDSGAFKDEESPNCSRRSYSRRREQTQEEEKGRWKKTYRIIKPVLLFMVCFIYFCHICKCSLLLLQVLWTDIYIYIPFLSTMKIGTIRGKIR